jgi:hypothetical protein
MIGSVLNLNCRTVHDILTYEMGIQKIVERWFPKNITNEHKEKRRNVCLDLLERIENDENVFQECHNRR